MPQINSENNVTVTDAEMRHANDEASLRKVARAVIAIARRQVVQEAAEESEENVDEQ